MKKRITIDLENELYLRLAIIALHRGTKVKNLIENNMVKWINQAQAQKEVSAAANQINK
jgi:hypothetical protein